MNTSVSSILGLAVGAVLIASPMIWADTGTQSAGKARKVSYHDGHRHGGGITHLLRHLLKHKESLGLSDEQMTRLRAVALEADRARIRAEADAMVSERELRSLLWDEKVEMGIIETKVKEKESFDATTRIIGIKAKRDLLDVLTAEQKTKLQTLWEERRSHGRGQMMRPGMGQSANGTIERESGRGASDTEVSDVEGGPPAG